MSVVSVQAKSFILALFIRDDGERFLLGDNGYEFKDGQLHFNANDIENDEVAKQGADGVMLAGQVRRSSVQEFEGYVGDATDAKDTIEDKRKAFIAFFASGHHFRVVYVDCNSNAWQRKGGYLVDAPEVKELWQIHPEYHVGLNFEDVNYYSYNEDAEGDEILANYLNVPVSSDVSGGLEWDSDGAVSEDATVEYDTETKTATKGKVVSFSDGISAPIADIQIDGETSQNTLSGKNLFDINQYVNAWLRGVGSAVGISKTNDTTLRVTNKVSQANNFAFVPLPNTNSLLGKTIIASVNVTFGSGATSSRLAWFWMSSSGLSSQIGSNLDLTSSGAYTTSITVPSSIPSGATNVGFGIYASGNSASPVDSYVDFSYIQVEKGTSATTYEPYCGGVASPNPDYPQAVQTVTGDNVVKICGKNLFQVTATSPSASSGVTYEKVSDSSFSITSDGASSWARADITLPQALELNTTYAFKVNFTSTNANITSIRASFRTTSAEASVFTLTNGQTAALSTGSNIITTLRIYITTNTAYSGTITFTDVQLEKGSSATTYEPYQGQSYEVNFDLEHGKNMLDPSTLVDGYISVNGEYNTAHSNGEMRSGMIAVSPSTAYTFSIQATSSTYDPWFGVGEYTADNVESFVRRDTNNASGATSITITTSATTNYIAVSARNLKTATKVQLEQGSSATTYETWSPLELCKIGNYQDYIWNDSGTWKKHKAVNKKVLVGDNSEGWQSGNMANVVRYNVFLSDSITGAASGINPTLCSHFQDVDPGTNWSTAVGSSNYCLVNSSQVYRFTKGEAIGSGASTDAWKTWLASNPITLYYPLATPTDETITNSALIEQLDALAEANIYAGTNNIFTITPNEQPSLEVDYYTKYIVKVTAGGYVWEEGGSGGPTTVINDSISNVSPVWTVYGPTVNPVLENTTTGEEIEYVGTIADGQTLVIDMGEQTALLNGLNVIGNVTGDYVSLAPGQNTLLYSTSSGDTDSEIGWSEIVG